jgi:hypothetical protein
MQFSIARLLAITLFVNFVVAATFAFPPMIGIPLMTFLAMFVVPPFIIVGVANTRGLRQSFFLGAMVTGTPHFVISAYIFVMVIVAGVGGDFSPSDFDEVGFYQYIHGAGFLAGSIGGACGMASYWFLKFGEPKKKTSEPDQVDPFSVEPAIEESTLSQPELQLTKTPK